VALEKHGDFLRDFRGDTIHPSTLEVMRELGLLDEFLKLPHQKVYERRHQSGDSRRRGDSQHSSQAAARRTARHRSTAMAMMT
jgi:2-polyprenyl-6-methoxyphenol hydroxylase-like FAD-dependent oxidoreductase